MLNVENVETFIQSFIISVLSKIKKPISYQRSNLPGLAQSQSLAICIIRRLFGEILEYVNRQPSSQRSVRYAPGLIESVGISHSYRGRAMLG